MKKIQKHMLAAAAGTLMMLSASSAFAGPNTQFTVDPSVLGGPAGLQQASYMHVAASELLRPNATFTGHDAVGVISITNMFAEGSLDPLNIGLGTNYRLYMTFDLSDTIVSGSFNGPNSSYAMTKLNVKFWADLNADTARNTAVGGGAVGVDPSLGGNTGDDVLLAVADLVSGLGTLTGSPGGSNLGAELKATLNFALCTGAGTAHMGGLPGGTPVTDNLADLASGAITTGIGKANGCTSDLGNRFFSSPKPFYELAFAAFTNTGQNAVPNADGTLAVNNAGQVDFGRVPEPGSLALLGLGLAGLGAMTKRRKA